MAVDRRNPKQRGRELWLPLLLFCLTLGIFLPCLRNGFVGFDDPGYVSENPHVPKGLTLENMKWAWTNTEQSNWHPLTWMSHLLDGQVFGLNPAGHHATSVALHALNATLLFLLLQRMTGARWRSFIVAALFGLHPLRVESVAWVSERKDVLSAFFWILTTWAYARYAAGASKPAPDVKNKYFYGLSLLFFALGLTAKPMLVTLPLTLLLLDYWPLRRWPGAPVKWLLLEKAPFLALAAASSAVTYMAQENGGAVMTGDVLNVPARMANALVSYARYLGMTAWPADLCAIYPHPGHWPAATVAGAGLLLAVVTAAAVWRWRDMPYLVVGWFWFIGALVPVIGLVQIGRQALADRYTYIPSIGLLIAVVWSVAKLAERWRSREILTGAAACAAMAVCAALTVKQIGYWKDSMSLFGHAYDVNPRNWVAAGSLAHILQDDGQPDAAIEMYRRALQINPYHSDIRRALAGLLYKQRRFNDAMAELQQAIAQDPNDAEARLGIGAVWQDLGQMDKAIEEFKKVTQLEPTNSDAYSNLGNCYGMERRPDDAIRCFEEAVKLKPSSAQNHRELGVGLFNQGRWDEAINQFQQALQLNPADTQARQNLDSATQAKATAPR